MSEVESWYRRHSHRFVNTLNCDDTLRERARYLLLTIRRLTRRYDKVCKNGMIFYSFMDEGKKTYSFVFEPESPLYATDPEHKLFEWDVCNRLPYYDLVEGPHFAKSISLYSIDVFC